MLVKRSVGKNEGKTNDILPTQLTYSNRISTLASEIVYQYVLFSQAGLLPSHPGSDYGLQLVGEPKVMSAGL